jgi:hypothetical protein
MGDVPVISAADTMCGSRAFHHFVAQRWALCGKFLDSLESPDRQVQLVAELSYM